MINKLWWLSAHSFYCKYSENSFLVVSGLTKALRSRAGPPATDVCCVDGGGPSGEVVEAPTAPAAEPARKPTGLIAADRTRLLKVAPIDARYAADVAELAEPANRRLELDTHPPLAKVGYGTAKSCSDSTKSYTLCLGDGSCECLSNRRGEGCKHSEAGFQQRPLTREMMQAAADEIGRYYKAANL